MDDFHFEITRHIAVLSQSKKGWLTELNFVAWGDNAPKYDIRSWSPDHQKMGKGVTLTKDELESLGKAISEEIK